jgi:hypothetical protein
MGWTADTNYNSIGIKSTLEITDGQAGAGARTRKLPIGVELNIRHPDGHVTKARITGTAPASAEIRLSDRTRWHITPFDPHSDLPTVMTPGRDVQVWIVRKQIV